MIRFIALRYLQDVGWLDQLNQPTQAVPDTAIMALDAITAGAEEVEPDNANDGAQGVEDQRGASLAQAQG
jgi:hypothetical protein